MAGENFDFSYEQTWLKDRHGFAVSNVCAIEPDIPKTSYPYSSDFLMVNTHLHKQKIHFGQYLNSRPLVRD